MSVLLAADLDRTLIYSRSAAGPHSELVCVEHRDGAPGSFMTGLAAKAYENLTNRNPVVPVTTRSPEQYARVRLPGPAARHAVVANGAMLLIDGAVDDEWRRRTERALGAVAALREVSCRLVQVTAGLARSVRTVGDFFCYAVVERERLPHDLVPDLTAWAAGRGWRVSLQGRKLYCVPEPLRKSDAVLELARRTEATVVLAAGDALLDADMLSAADRGIRPAHGELYELGWTAPNVGCTTASGAAAAEEILAFFASQCEP